MRTCSGAQAVVGHEALAAMTRSIPGCAGFACRAFAGFARVCQGLRLAFADSIDLEYAAFDAFIQAIKDAYCTPSIHPQAQLTRDLREAVDVGVDQRLKICCRTLGRRVALVEQHLPHGLANALLLTTVIRFNAAVPRAGKRYARLAKACGFCPAEANDVTAINALIQQIERLKQSCALPSLAVALKEGRSDFSARIPAMVQAALADVTLRTNPRPASAGEIRELLEELL